MHIASSKHFFARTNKMYSGNADFFVQTAFSYRFRIVLESYRFMPFQTPLKEKTAFKRRFILSANHKALIKPPFIVSNGPVYHLFY